MGVTRKVAERVDLATMLPLPDIASTRYCLAEPGKQYIVYVPSGNEVTVNLTDAKGKFKAEWVHPIKGTTESKGIVEGGVPQTLNPPFEGDAVLLLLSARS